MKIVVLDGYALNPGDLNWDGLAALGDLTVHEHSTADQVVGRAAGAEVLLTNKCPVGAEQISALPDLRCIGVLATGFNIVDVEAARARNIPVVNVPTYGTASVAQMVLAHILHLTQNVGHHAGTVSEGRWAANRDFCYWDTPLIELENLTLGIVGFGRIGGRVAELARAFGMNVVVATRDGRAPDNSVRTVDLDELFRISDIISLHCPLTPATEGIVSAERLAAMKSTAFLVNTSRGPLVDEAALLAALNEERIAGAGLDVLAVEPPKANHPLYTAKNCYITPHIAWATGAARTRLLATVVDNVRAYAAGEAQNVVN
jgi:glycerate dehydrogenase